MAKTKVKRNPINRIVVGEDASERSDIFMIREEGEDLVQYKYSELPREIYDYESTTIYNQMMNGINLGQVTPLSNVVDNVEMLDSLASTIKVGMDTEGNPTVE